MIASMSQARPPRCTGRIARVRCVTAGSIRAGSRFPVARSTSTNTGRAPRCTMTFAVEHQVYGVVITSSPGPTPSTCSARCSAEVHEFTATAWRTPTYSSMRRSNCFTRGPDPIQPLRSVATTSAISSSEISGAPKTRKSFRMMPASLENARPKNFAAR